MRETLVHQSPGYRNLILQPIKLMSSRTRMWGLYPLYLLPFLSQSPPGLHLSQPPQSQDEHACRDSAESAMSGAGRPGLETQSYDQLVSGLGHVLLLPGLRTLHEEVEARKSSFI